MGDRWKILPVQRHGSRALGPVLGSSLVCQARCRPRFTRRHHGLFGGGEALEILTRQTRVDGLKQRVRCAVLGRAHEGGCGGRRGRRDGHWLQGGIANLEQVQLVGAVVEAERNDILCIQNGMFSVREW